MLTDTLQQFAPDHIIVLEEQILGTILSYPETFPDVQELPHTAFSVTANRRIFMVVRDVFRDGRSPNLMVVTDRLHSSGFLSEVGGRAYLAYLIDCCPRICRLKEDAELLEESALKREIASTLVTDENFDEMLEKMQRIKSGRKKDRKMERIKLELQLLASESDSIKQIVEIISFCQRYGWSKRDVEQQIRTIKTGSTTQQARRITGPEFLAMESETIRWIYPGIIPARGVCILAGHPGAGKTTLAYDIAASVVLDEEFLGEKPAVKGRVLIVSADELPCFTQDKLIERGMPLDNPNWDMLLNYDVSQPEILESTLEEKEYALMIVDGFASIHRDPLFDENSSQAKSTIYYLEALSNKYNCACVLLHHLSKSKDNHGVSKLRGSSAIAAAASVVCLMESNADGTRKLSFPKIRGAQTEPLTIDLDTATGRYQVLTGGEPESVKSLGECVVEFLRQHPAKRFEQAEISHALGLPANSDAMYQALSRLHRKGEIIKRPSAVGGRRKVYGIPASEIEGITPPPVLEEAVRNEPETIDAQAFQVPDSNPDTLADLVENQRKRYQHLEQQPDGELIPLPIPDKFPDNSEKRGGDQEKEEVSVTADEPWSEDDIEGLRKILLLAEDKETVCLLRKTYQREHLIAACRRISKEHHALLNKWVVELNAESYEKP